MGLTHPVQRRRREKKLLKLDEVNERFPVMTYKAWRAQREREGLSAEGGIANQTHANSPLPTIASAPESTEPTPPRSPTPLNDTEITQTPIPPETRSVSSEKAPQIEVSEKSPVPVSDSDSELPEPPITPIASSSKQRDSTFSLDPDVEDEEEHHHPIPDELLATTGDNCAICIELLEDEDEVRGLTCGHCYHQTCIDPWLTQRRASCPLCKADYYVPKPPPEGSDPANAANTPGRTSGERAVQPVTTEHWAPLFLRPFRPVMVPSSSHAYGAGYPTAYTRYQNSTMDNSPPASVPRMSRWRIQRIDRQPDLRTDPPEAQTVSPGRSWRDGLRNPFRRNRQDNSEQMATTTTEVDLNTLERGEGSQRNDGQ